MPVRKTFSSWSEPRHVYGDGSHAEKLSKWNRTHGFYIVCSPGTPPVTILGLVAWRHRRRRRPTRVPSLTPASSSWVSSGMTTRGASRCSARQTGAPSSGLRRRWSAKGWKSTLASGQPMTTSPMAAANWCIWMEQSTKDIGLTARKTDLGAIYMLTAIFMWVTGKMTRCMGQVRILTTMGPSIRASGKTICTTG